MTKDTPVPGNAEDHSDIEPTTVGLPKLEPLQELHLAAEERSALNALPVGSALLVAHEGPNRGARFLLDQDRVTVGRHPDADIFLDDVTVSRQHAVFEREGSDFRMTDTGSLNGTYINHDRVDSIILRTGMELQIGKFRLSYYAGTQHPKN